MLPAEPFACNAVACNDKFIFVIPWEGISIFVFNWAAALLCSIDECQLDITGSFIRSIGYINDRIVLAVGSPIRSLHMYTVQ